MTAPRITPDAGPPLGVPFRFFVTAPWLGAVGAALLALGGADAWASRWTPAMLAGVHLLTLGFLAMTMVGALFQVVPVLGGRGIPAAARVAPPVHLGLTLGAQALAAALLWHDRIAAMSSLALLVAAFLGFGVALGARLVTRIGAGDSMLAIRLAAVAMLATVGLGAMLALGHAAPSLGIPYRAWTDVHAAWGLCGWMLLLVIGVSLQVIPMFHVAPSYPRWLARGSAVGLFTALVPLGFVRSPRVATVLLTLAAVSVLAWAGATVWVLRRRRRLRFDAMVGFWYMAVGSVATAALLVWWRRSAVALPDPLPAGRTDLVLGVLLIVGFGMSVIVGMQQKIVPFLIFLHLQRRCLVDVAASRHLPTMAEIVTDARARVQLYLHAAALTAVLGGALWAPAGPAGAGLLAVDLLWLATTQLLALQRYVVAKRIIAAAIGAAGAEPASA